MEIDDIPGDVYEDYIKKVSEKRNISINTVLSEFDRVYNSEKVQRQTTDDIEKAKWSGKIVYFHFMSKETVREELSLTIIPFGISEIVNGINGQWANMFALIKNDKGIQVNKIYHRGEQVKLLDNVSLFHVYNDVKLIFKGFFFETCDNTRYDNPQRMKISNEDIITKITKFPKITKLSDMVANESKRDPAGYVDKMDMFLIEGMVMRKYLGLKNGRMFSVYNIKDESLEYEEKVVTINGKNVIIPQTISVWVPNRFMKWDVDSELSFLGTIKVDKKPSMNAISVYPNGFVVDISESQKK